MNHMVDATGPGFFDGRTEDHNDFDPMCDKEYEPEDDPKFINEKTENDVHL